MRLVKERSQARWNGDYALADTIKEQIQQLAKDGGCDIILNDKPRKEGGGTSWHVEPVRRSDAEKKEFMDQVLPGPTVLQLAHMALGAAVQESVETSLARAHHVLQNASIASLKSSAEGDKIQRDVAELIRQANVRLEKLEELPDMISYELGGRKAADAAFWFALAGCQDRDFLNLLADFASTELQRFCTRPSCRTKDVLQIVERFAAAGVSHERLQRVAEGCLASRSNGEDTTFSLHLHASRSLLLIWKFSTKQTKQYAFLKSAQKHWERHKNNVDFEADDSVAQSETTHPTSSDGSKEYDWAAMFDDPTRPLVVDLGCGFGVSILGLSTKAMWTPNPLLSDGMDLSDCNFVGVDLGQLGTGYATGVAKRWRLSNTRFVVDDCEDFCESLSSYPGGIQLFLLQFPTPYRLNTLISKGYGNSQLPTSKTKGFMVTDTLLIRIQSALHKSGGKLLVQSNVEDVAVFIRNRCLDLGFSHVDDALRTTLVQEQTREKRIPQRTLDWIEMGGERAAGPGWFQDPLLDTCCITETEAACELNGTPIHRCILKATKY